MIMTAQELVSKGIGIYNDRKNWTYVQGALGQLGESDRVRGLYNYFWNMPNHGGNSMTMDYAAWLPLYGQGKHCTDCSNFLNYLLGYTFSMYSTDGYYKMPAFEGPIEEAPVGTALCMKGHVGLCIGNGEFIDFYKYNETCRKAKIKDSLFEKAVYITGVVYDYSPVVSLTAMVRDKTRYVGDTVSTDDFVVTVTREDGTSEIVTDFQITPLQLTNTVNVIAIVYATLITYVVVNADPIGTFYCVQIPADSKEQAILMQQQLTLAGYSNPAVVEL